MSRRLVISFGIILALLAVVLGAFGAHALKSVLNEYSTQIWQTASDYHFYHALGLLLLGIRMDKTAAHALFKMAALGLSLGVIVFCGSLYLLALTEVSKLAMLTPVGGLLFILGWLCWLIAEWKKPQSTD